VRGIKLALYRMGIKKLKVIVLVMPDRMKLFFSMAMAAHRHLTMNNKMLFGQHPRFVR
jgi:hypothetical protein